MKTVSTIAGEFNREQYKELKRLYDNAVANQLTEFTVPGREGVMLTVFAKYLLEYLAYQFE